MGAVEYGPGEAKGTPWHPHRGFETVTYMMDGAFEHQDSTGGGGLITDGATQWMTAGAGILHIEKPPEALVSGGGLFHGVQLWVNLPAAAKWTPPRYQDIHGGDVTLVSSPDGGALVRVIAGSIGGHEGPGSTFTPITYLHVTLSPGGAGVAAVAGRLQRPGVRALRPRAGRRRAAPSRRGPARRVRVRRRRRDRRPRSPAGRRRVGWEILVLGGLPIGEPVARYGPFVMNTRAEIFQALEDFEAGRMGRIPAEKVPHRTEADDPVTP